MPRPAFQLLIRLPKSPRMDGGDARVVMDWALTSLQEALDAWPLAEAPHVVLEPYKEAP